MVVWLPQFQLVLKHVKQTLNYPEPILFYNAMHLRVSCDALIVCQLGIVKSRATYFTRVNIHYLNLHFKM